MFIQPDKLYEIMSPKKGCQRGLEEYIVGQHWGDKKLYHPGGDYSGSPHNSNNPHSYMYLNNPIYRVGKEGDPAPGSLSSRSVYQLGDYEPGFSETESALHLLYPTIDSGSEYLYEKPWDMQWYYSRTNIPNQFGTPQEVSDSDLKMREYDDSVERKRASEKISDWMNRPLPIYDQDRINDEALPDGVRQIELGPIRHDNSIPIVGNSPGKTQVMGKNNSNVENYTTNLTGYNTVPSAGIGAYGYPRPNAYATMGESKHRYDLFPGFIPGVNVEYYTSASKESPMVMWIGALLFMGMLFLIVRKK